jgi:hypothetical protein
MLHSIRQKHIHKNRKDVEKIENGETLVLSRTGNGSAAVSERPAAANVNNGFSPLAPAEISHGRI